MQLVSKYRLVLVALSFFVLGSVVGMSADWERFCPSASHWMRYQYVKAFWSETHDVYTNGLGDIALVLKGPYQKKTYDYLERKHFIKPGEGKL